MKSLISGSFIFVQNKESLKQVLFRINKTTNENWKFDLVVPGSKTQEIIEYMNKECEYKSIKRICIFTYSVDKWKSLKDKFQIVKGVYFNINEVLSFIKEDEGKFLKFRSLKLCTLEDYKNKYYSMMHKIVAKYYGNFNDEIYQNNNEKVKSFIREPGDYRFEIVRGKDSHSVEESILTVLKLYKDIEENYIEIIKNYTSQVGSIYQDFNKILRTLNLRGTEAFSYFIAGLMYSLDKYRVKYGKGIEYYTTLYKGMKMSVIDQLNYERYNGKIICFPSFFSTSVEKEITELSFCQRVVDLAEIHPEIRNETFNGKKRYIVIDANTDLKKTERCRPIIWEISGFKKTRRGLFC